MKLSLPLLAVFAISASVAPAQEQAPGKTPEPIRGTKAALPPAVQLLGGGTFSNWSGVDVQGAGASLKIPGQAVFAYPPENDSSPNPRSERNWFNAFGVRFEVQLPDARPLNLEVSLADPKAAAIATARMILSGSGSHPVSLPWSAFDLQTRDEVALQDVGGLRISGSYQDGKTAAVGLRKPVLARGENVWLHADVRSKSVEAGGTADYELMVGNATDASQVVTLAFEKRGYEGMSATVEPPTLELTPGETKLATVHVTVPSRIPPGGHEIQKLRATGNGQSGPADSVEFITASRLSHPYILHTAAGWQEVREKVQKYPWAKAAQDGYVEHAEKWNVPNVHNTADPKLGDWLFPTQVENDLMAAGIAHQLTGEKRYAEKVRTFLLRLSDPANGFPVTRRGCNQSSVQEGHFFQHIAMAYDMALPSGVFTESDRQQIDRTLRLFIGEQDHGFGRQISNWNVSSLCGGLYCALDLQDLAAADRYLNAPGALIDQLCQGTLDDGWWYELSISYNTWVATEMSQVAIAMQPWGFDLAHTQFPCGFRPSDQRVPEKTEYGITDAKWGPIRHNWMGIKRMWDVLPAMSDYRGVMFGLNDSAERPIGGEAMEIAYYLYRDPAYAAVIKRGNGNRDLIYGVPELPDNAPDLSAVSTYADNAGVAVLRSKSEGKTPRERIQAVLCYGDHGWYHGHFDTVSLGHLSRYGRSFYNPEMVWYGYGSYMYKFYVQTSVSKNMVVVDDKQQEPAENQRILFHSGEVMQAAAVEVKTRWSNPPYGGIVDESKTFAQKALAEGHSLAIPANPPPYKKGESVTGYTEPVLQRRLMVVTDDYVLLADYLKGEKEHTFDSLFQMKGFQGLDAPEKKLARHTGQWNPDPVGSAQFVTDCDWYQVKAPARGTYQFRWDEPADKAGTRTEPNEPGVLNMDVYTLWPARQELMIGTVPEAHPVAKQVSFAVKADENILANGTSGMWILGEQVIDVPLQGASSLELQSQTGATRNPTLFWANARIVTANGKEIPLAKLPASSGTDSRLISENTAQPPQPGKDFAGGPVKIAGLQYNDVLSAQPMDGGKPALTKVDLKGINAVRFKAVIGGDFPVGDEAQLRKTVAVRSQGNEARFLTLIEPFEEKRMVKSATAKSADTIRVELADGRVHELKIAGLDGKTPSVEITETKDGKIVRTEKTE